MRFSISGPFVLALPLATTSLALAQAKTPEEPISTVRPRFVDTTRIVPVGRFQFEAGADFGFGGPSFNRRDTYAGLLRYGIAPRLEARVDLPYVDYRAPFGSDGFANLSVALSWSLGRVGTTSLALQPRLTLPTARFRLARPEEPSPTLALTGETPLGGGWSFASTLSYNHAKYDFEGFLFDETVRYDTYHAGFAIERAFGGRASAFVEYFGDYRNGERPYQLANAGARYRLSPRQQVDVRVTAPIANGNLANAVGVGYSVRF